MTIERLNWICWGAFITVWILGAIYNSYKAPAMLQSRSRFDWIILAVGVFLIMHVQLISSMPHRYLKWMAYHVIWLQVVGAAVLILSTMLTLWARLILGKMWASHAQIKVDHRLVTNGPYQITRNPIYTGILGMTFGSALSLGQGIILFGIIAELLFFMNRIRNEEKLLADAFGEQFLQYKSRVPQLIPGLKIRRH